MRDQISIDLEKLAIDRVKAALDSVYQLTDDPGTLLRIALMSSSVCIGGASGFLAGLVSSRGNKCTEQEAQAYIIDLLKIGATGGADAMVQAIHGHQ